MLFQKSAPKVITASPPVNPAAPRDDVETVVGPSVTVEGDFASEGNITVKGTVAGSVRTSKHLSVERGAKILANVRAATAEVAGEVRGNMKIKESLELTASARVVGDVEVKTLSVEAGALIYGKLAMPGIEGVEGRGSNSRAGVKPAGTVKKAETGFPASLPK